MRRRLIESKVAEALTARLANEAAGALARSGGTLAEAVGRVDEGGGNDGPPPEQEGADDEGASDAGASEDGGPPPVFDDLGAPPPRPTRAQLAAQAEARRIDEEAKARARAYELRNRKPNYAPVLPPPSSTRPTASARVPPLRARAPAASLASRAVSASATFDSINRRRTSAELRAITLSTSAAWRSSASA